ncbi:hypothetical protein J1N35_014698 [Gossypium stocksii]|uniref:Uncharacterized protein n=1 Tax=Gossypium stocksii TaxID=47602 RepID=A0A9D4AA57_9ROSI|nr:hypothetical protein J1N35_014698 [Gossypium stocksii]
MKVRSVMQNVQGGPSRISAGEGSANSRKKQKTIARAENVILSSEEEDSHVRELYQKKWKDHTATSGDMANIVTVLAVISSPSSSLVSPLPPRPPTGDTFVGNSTPEGSMRFMSTGGETQALFPWCEHLKVGMVSVLIIEGINEEKVKKVEFENVHLSTMGALERAYYEKFVEEWKNFNKLYFADDPAETCVAPITVHEGDRNERDDEGEDEELAEPKIPVLIYNFITFIVLVFYLF